MHAAARETLVPDFCPFSPRSTLSNLAFLKKDGIEEHVVFYYQIAGVGVRAEIKTWIAFYPCFVLKESGQRGGLDR